MKETRIGRMVGAIAGSVNGSGTNQLVHPRQRSEISDEPVGEGFGVRAGLRSL
jgi:hypothetical protein